MKYLCILLSFLICSTATAQDVAPPPAEEFVLPEPGEILPLRRGASAPHDGLLIEAADLLRIQQEYDRMRYLLTRTSERDREICDVRIAMEGARLTACEERLRLRDELWTARQTELNLLLTEARAEARRAAERGWYENPILWFLVGVAVTVVVWIAVSVR